MDLTHLREGLLVGVVTMIMLSIVLSVLDAIGTWELLGIGLVSLATGVVVANRDRPSGSTTQDG